MTNPIAAPAGSAPRRPARQLASGLVVCIAFFIAALSWSPLLPGLFHIPLTVALFAGVVPFTLATAAVWRTQTVAVACTLAMLFGSAALMAASQSAILLTRTAPIALLAFVAYQCTRIPGVAIRICRALTLFLQIGVVGAIIGQVYAFLGGAPVLTVANVDGRENALYLTTMSNFVWLGVIRPAFIYDEPGAFSFLLCATVALREMLGMKRGASLFLLMGGLMTFSITHMIITLLYLLTRFGVTRVVIVLALVLIPLIPRLNSIEELNFISDRFSIVDGGLSGDNRSNQLKNFAAVVDGRMVIFGDIDCQKRPDKICEDHGDITSSPATPVYKGGILALITQLCVHVALVVAFFNRRQFRFCALAMSLLLLQRPYFEIAGYGFITYLIVFMMIQHMRRQFPAWPRQGNSPVPAVQALSKPGS